MRVTCRRGADFLCRVAGCLGVVLVTMALQAGMARATTVYPAKGPQHESLTIYSTTDTSVFQPVIGEFQRLRPDIAVRYVDIEAAPLYERFLRETAEGRPLADLLLSSSMDLQAKLVNDGYAAPHTSENARSLPAWARWRDEAFGFTFEPAVMVFNRRMMDGKPLPGTRGELLAILKSSPKDWHGRIGTYDISTSSVGYLLASQDARQSSEFGALVEAFGDAGVRVEERTGTLLDLIESGELKAGYNLLGSYARARAAAGAQIEIVYPLDYTLAVSRTAVLPKNAPNPAAAHAFLEYLLSPAGQEILSTRSYLSSIRQGGDGNVELPGLNEATIGQMRPIALGPGLLVYLDQLKRARMLESWRAIIGSRQPAKPDRETGE